MAAVMPLDDSILDDLIRQVEMELVSGKDKRQQLMRFSLEGPSIISPEFRLAELRKLRAGIPSEWAMTEIKAEKAYREREARNG